MTGVSLDHPFPRPCPSQKILSRCSYSVESDQVIPIDVDPEIFENIIVIEVPDSLPKNKPRPIKLRTKEWSFRNVINVDDDEAAENNHSVGLNNMNASAGTSSKGEFCKRGKNSTDCADDVVEKNQSANDNATPVRLSKCKRTYSGNASTGNQYGLDVESERDTSHYDYCELVEDSSGNVEELWRKTDVNSGKFGFGGVSGSSSIYKDDHENAGEEYRFKRNKGPYQVRRSDCQARGSKSQNKKEAEHPTSSNISLDGQPTEFDQPTPVFGDRKFSTNEQEDVGYSRREIEAEIASAASFQRADSKNIEEATGSSVREPKHPESRKLHPTAIPVDIRGSTNLCEGNGQEDESLFNSQQSGNKNGQLEMQNVDAFASNVTCMILDREKIKETDEYKRAMEDEWASRQEALQIQAQEAQNLRRLMKRKKTESIRLLDMERRQKERLEEIRTSQKKEEENVSLKEATRVEVRKQLKDLEIKCKSMSSLLYSLGIIVAGWPNPSPQQVQTSYKRALLAFHPDRASRSDIRQQVEAEEKFKLINRLREKFASKH